MNIDLNNFYIKTALYALIFSSVGYIIHILFTALSKKKAKAKITIKIPIEQMTYKYKVGLLYVRDGKDEFSDLDKSPLKNKLYWFKDNASSNNLEVNLYYNKRLGFQYKCFIDYENDKLNQIITLLKKSGYKNIAEGKGKEKRIWFINPKHEVYRVMSGILNNFYYPE